MDDGIPNFDVQNAEESVADIEGVSVADHIPAQAWRSSDMSG